MLDLVTGKQTILAPDGSNPRYVQSGHLVYALDGMLHAVPFDASRRVVTSDPVPVGEGVVTKLTGAADFSLGGNGLLVYVTGSGGTGTSRIPSSLLWVDGDGREESLGVPLVGITTLSLSPDNRSAAFGQIDVSGNIDVWTSDLSRGTLTRVTAHDAADGSPLFSRDGRRIAFQSGRDGNSALFWKSADGTGSAELLLTIDASTGNVIPWDWSSDGSTLFLHAEFAQIGRDIGMVSIEGGPGSWEPLIQTPANEWSPVLSPNGRWLAYTSDETGYNEIYLQRFPELTDRHQISVGGGIRPEWSANGDALIYLRTSSNRPPDAVMRVAIDVAEEEPSFVEVASPEMLFAYSYAHSGFGFRHHDIATDGRLLVVRYEAAANESEVQPEIVLVQNWFEELKRLVPTN